MRDLQAYLERVSPLTKEDWNLTVQSFKEEKYKKGDFFINEGRHCNKVSFVSKGLFKLYYLTEGQERIMLFFVEGQFLTDYFGYLTQTPSIRPIQALEDSVVYTITRDELNHLIKTSQTWSNIARVMAERAYVFAVQRANRLLHDDFDTRFITFMTEYPSLLQRVPQYMIASYLDMTPETLSRVKKRTFKNNPSLKSIHEGIDPQLL
ncbi:cAMP-binding domain of CRP or a regulatory subunit of cAMP-dependent protein kinases [Cyclobacterium xiamenense]|uniref:cAMP-binding domain of CRP or a regulatory subunit of cAMP-dependent protein kinases n=1 Tax=Cyclobacterium xiamenense TaxID=1297121 RepID=A0A1H7AEQ2_9BACT|nr:Crp/Fnr family transcriptional regulator [Cyclobacterium xiamenense]SEJ63034.1 cAMP-binding domain of CRP or a regulatory subunit of cAMP-dependent protein kinases [Cyclobacterium xiamenense]